MKSQLLIFRIFFVCAFFPLSTHGQASLEKIDVLHYVFELRLTDSSNEIRGRASVRIRFLQVGTRAFTLNLVEQDPATGRGMQVLDVQGAEGVQVAHEGDELQIMLAEATRAVGEEQTFIISYRGIPADGLIISKNKYGDRTFFGDNWPNRARHWLPTVDHPADKATCEFIVTSPDHYEVIGNGYKVEESDLPGDRVLTHWRTDVPLPTKVMVIGAARFAIRYQEPHNHISVESWVYPQDRKPGFFDFAPAREILAYFEEWIGPYPFEKLANVQSKTRYGGLENASAIFYAENSVTGGRDSDDLIAHEVAHQWFGNSATEKDWPHIWLSEGFATYFADLWIESTQGRDSLEKRMQTERAIILQYAIMARKPVIDTSATDPNRLLNPNSYEKGAWVLHMLRHHLGDETFKTGIRKYYEDYQGKNADTDQLEATMEEVSGKKLDRFFEQWLRQPGHPVLDLTWSYLAKQKSLQLNIEQKQTTPFEFPLDIGIRYRGDSKQQVKTVKVANRTENLVIPLDAEPEQIVPDPNTWLLFEHNLRRQ